MTKVKDKALKSCYLFMPINSSVVRLQSIKYKVQFPVPDSFKDYNYTNLFWVKLKNERLAQGLNKLLQTQNAFRYMRF